MRFAVFRSAARIEKVDPLPGETAQRRAHGMTDAAQELGRAGNVQEAARGVDGGDRLSAGQEGLLPIEAFLRESRHLHEDVEEGVEH